MHCLVSFAGEKFLIFCGLVGRSQLQMFCKVVILKISFKIFDKYFEEVESRQKVWKYEQWTAFSCFSMIGCKIHSAIWYLFNNCSKLHLY